MRPSNYRFFLPVGLVFVVTTIGVTLAQNAPPANDGPVTQGIGLIRNDPGAFQGYTLISPLQSKTTFLIDMNGRVIKLWETDSTPSSLAYLLDNGHLLRAGELANGPFARFAGIGGKVQEFDWDGNIVWDFVYATAT